MGYRQNPLFDLDSNGVGFSSTTLRARKVTSSIYASTNSSNAIQGGELDDGSFASSDRLRFLPSAHLPILLYNWY